MIVDKETLFKLRNVMLELLNKFVQICEENNLTYFLAYGTLLGAVRHKGFIPWDNDIDVAMPRDDYEKFLDIFENNNSTKYYVLSSRCQENTHYRYKFYAKFCLKGTVYAEDHLDVNDYFGIFIDLWPYDNCVKFLLPLQLKLFRFARKLYGLRTHKDLQKSKIKLILSKIFCFFVSLKFRKKFLKSSYTFFNKFKTHHIFFFSDYSVMTEYKSLIQNINTVFPLTKLSFEGKYYFAPVKWNVFLTNLYGDYMKFPPVEQQIGHPIKFISFGDEKNI
jgi:lipopolysaccharide cholinephosphotransferase